jgi:hypothetical protein
MAKSAPGDKSAAWLPVVYGQPNMASLLTLGHGDTTQQAPLGEAVRLVEKVAGMRRQNRDSWEGEGGRSPS